MAVVYHWKHGWIPLDHEAALSKAKGNHTLAAAYLRDAPHAKGIDSRQHVAKAVLDLPNVPSVDRADAHRQLREAATAHDADDLLPVHLRIPDKNFDYAGFVDQNWSHAGTDWQRAVKNNEPMDPKLREAIRAHVTHKDAAGSRRTSFNTSPSATPWHPMTDGSQWREAPAGLIVWRGNRELHLLGNSVDARNRAKRLIADHSFDKLFKRGRSAPGMKNVAYIKL